MHGTLARLFSIDTRALAFARVASGSLLLFDLFDRARDLRTFYFSDGIMMDDPIWANGLVGRWAIFGWVHSEWWVGGIFLVIALAAIAVVFGYRTTLATIVSFLLLTSLQNANQSVNYGADQVLRIILFLGIFLSWGRAYSFDALERGSHVPRDIVSPFTALALIQVAILYTFSGLHKSGIDWQNGSAVGLALSSSRFGTHFGNFIGTFSTLTNFLTFFVKNLLHAAPFLFFTPWYTDRSRMGIVFLLASMHVVFLFTLVILWFPWICIVALSLFLPSIFWDTVSQKFRLLCINLQKHGFEMSARITVLYQTLCANVPSRKYASVFATSIEPWEDSPAAYGFVAFILLLLVIWNVENLLETNRGTREFHHPQWMEKIIKPLGLSQNWAFFAPDAPHLIEWPLVRVVWSDGSETNPLTNWEAVEWEKPRFEVDTYGSIRWSNYLWNLRRARNYKLWPGAAAYFCRLAREHSPPGLYPLRVYVYNMSMPRLEVKPDGVVRLLLASQVCRRDL